MSASSRMGQKQKCLQLLLKHTEHVRFMLGQCGRLFQVKEKVEWFGEKEMNFLFANFFRLQTNSKKAPFLSGNRAFRNSRDVRN